MDKQTSPRGTLEPKVGFPRGPSTKRKTGSSFQIDRVCDQLNLVVAVQWLSRRKSLGVGSRPEVAR